MGIELIFIIPFFVGGLLVLIFASKFEAFVYDVYKGFGEGLPENISSIWAKLFTPNKRIRKLYIWLYRIIGVVFISVSLWMLYWVSILGHKS